MSGPALNRSVESRGADRSGSVPQKGLQMSKYDQANEAIETKRRLIDRRGTKEVDTIETLLIIAEMLTDLAQTRHRLRGRISSLSS